MFRKRIGPTKLIKAKQLGVHFEATHACSEIFCLVRFE